MQARGIAPRLIRLRSRLSASLVLQAPAPVATDRAAHHARSEFACQSMRHLPKLLLRSSELGFDSGSHLLKGGPSLAPGLLDHVSGFLFRPSAFSLTAAHRLAPDRGYLPLPFLGSRPLFLEEPFGALAQVLEPML